MKEGDVILVPLSQADGRTKSRPAILLRIFPPFGDFLVCGVSTQLRQQVAGFDEIIRKYDADFALSGLRQESLIRLGFLAVFPRDQVTGSIGEVSLQRHHGLLKRLADYLISDQKGS
jgi:mRNA interferase MazF